MTHKVLRARWPDARAFEDAVRIYVVDRVAHDRHAAEVAAGRADPYPAPNPHHDVVAAVRRAPDGSLVPDFALVDALPVPPGDRAALEARREELRQRVLQMELTAMHAVLSPGRWKLIGLQVTAASQMSEKDRTPEDHALLVEHDARMKLVRAIRLHHAQMEVEVDDLDDHTINHWEPRPYAG